MSCLRRNSSSDVIKLAGSMAAAERADPHTIYGLPPIRFMPLGPLYDLGSGHPLYDLSPLTSHRPGYANVRFASDLPAIIARWELVLPAVRLVTPPLLAINDARLDHLRGV